VTDGAAAKSLLPTCDAVTPHEPAVTMCTVVPLTVQALPATAVRLLINGEFVHRYSIAEMEGPRRICAALLVPCSFDSIEEQRPYYRSALERCFERRRSGDRWFLSQFSTIAQSWVGARPETIFGVRIDAVETSGIRAIRSSVELRSAMDIFQSKKNQDFNCAFLELCEHLRHSRVSSHLFLIHPETAPTIDSHCLALAAHDARVSVHAICRSHDTRIRDLSRATDGFYMVGEDLAELLPTLYQGLTHRYQASLAADVEIHRAQVAVRSADSFGESSAITLNS